MVNFYTGALPYHDRPFAYQDVDGRYLGMDKKVHTAEPGYVNYSALVGYVPCASSVNDNH